MQRNLDIFKIFLSDYVEANLVLCDFALGLRYFPNESIVPVLLSLLGIFLVQSTRVVVPIDLSIVVFSFFSVQLKSVYVHFELVLDLTFSFAVEDIGVSVQAMYVLDKGRNFTMPFVMKFDGFVAAVKMLDSWVAIPGLQRLTHRSGVTALGIENG